MNQAIHSRRIPLLWARGQTPGQRKALRRTLALLLTLALAVLPINPRPGVALRLKVRVSKGNPTVEGGGRVVVSLGGQPVDTLPFYMDPADDDITFYKSYEFPMNLNAGPSPLLRAVIEPDRLVTDPDLANNTISVPMDIQPPTLPDEGTDSAARIVSLSVHSEFGDGVAKAGANLTLRAQVAGGGGRTRITYAVNSAEVDIRGVTTSKTGTATHAGQGRSYPLYAYQGQEQDCNLSWVAVPDPVTAAASGECHVAPYVVCASMPGTFWNPDYEVEAIYGMFDLALFTTIENGVLNHVDVDTTPQWWVSATVSSSWDPSELFGYGQLVPGYPILTALLPLSVPLAIDMHSANRTMVRIRKVSVTSGGQEVHAAWPDAIGDYVCAPNTAVDWNDCRIKLYLKADPDNGVVNPAAGYNLDRVLVEFNPATKKFTKVGNYQVIGWDENLAREIYMDE